MSECPHTAKERHAFISMEPIGDGHVLIRCPICLWAENERLRKEVEDARAWIE
jgi:hypothetical protein